ncbi:MAG TPA: hypothetical protein VN231_10760 [Allosphingosinicella sp.]|nr:hypothetical protein [Allosphingosinicella sp.]
MAEIVPLEGREKRLKSLDEFEPPSWAARGGERRSGRPGMAAWLCLAVSLGGLIGLLLPF